MKISYTSSCGFTRILLFSFLFFASISHAQVGIGNTNPNASSMLDITSTEKGFLAPRMTTAQRNAITTPANSLLVYDTDLKSFYYYDLSSVSWVKVNSGSNQRNNYKLVKSVSDLAPELALGGGNRYLLQTNTYYEINGTILLAFPIDLNNAYLSGLDANEDILFRATGAVFQGTSGGSIRNVTLTGGGSAFNITGGTSLLVQNTVVANFGGGVGTISNVGLYFGNIVQFVGNTGGITYNNIPTLLLSNQAWFADNTGTYEKFTGTFGLVQKISGFSTVNSPAIGFDVSANPVVGTGVMLSTVFTGTGNYINGYMPEPYIGHDFTNQWTVDCPGILEESDRVASAHMYFALENALVTNITSNNIPVKMAGTTTASGLYRMSTDGINNRIKYKGERQRHFTVTSSATIERTDNGSRNVYSLIIYKNGAIIPSIVSEQTFENGISKANFTVVGSLTLDTDDYIEVFVSTDNSNIDPTVTRFNLVIE